MQNMAKINCSEIMNLIKNIKVLSFDNEDVSVENPTSLQMIGKGRHGAVFAINENICVKIYGEEDVCARELHALSLGQHTTLLPKIYCSNKNFIVMEIIKGIDLREYLQSQPLTKQMSAKLIKLLSTFKEIGFERIDHHKRHIFVQEDGSLKVLDVGTTVWRNRVYPYPRKLLNSLGDEYKSTFLEHVKEIDPKLYNEWETYMELENLASSIHQAHFDMENDNTSNYQIYSQSLLTKSKEWEEKVEDLVRKVHKEEWIKALIAKGMNPNKIKDIASKLEDELIYNKESNSKKDKKNDKKDEYKKDKDYKDAYIKDKDKKDTDKKEINERKFNPRNNDPKKVRIFTSNSKYQNIQNKYKR